MVLVRFVLPPESLIVGAGPCAHVWCCLGAQRAVPAAKVERRLWVSKAVSGSRWIGRRRGFGSDGVIGVLAED